MTDASHIFDQVEAAVLNGNFSELAILAEKLDDFRSSIPEKNPDQLRLISERAKRVARLIDAAKIGITDGKEKYRDICQPDTRFVLYRANGQKQNVIVNKYGKSIRA